MSECNTAKTALMVLPCEVARLPGRIKNKSWGWKDTSACKCSQENGNLHILFLVGYLAAAAVLTMNPVLIAFAGIVAAVKLKNFIRSKV